MDSRFVCDGSAASDKEDDFQNKHNSSSQAILHWYDSQDKHSFKKVGKKSPSDFINKLKFI